MRSRLAAAAAAAVLLTALPAATLLAPPAAVASKSDVPAECPPFDATAWPPVPGNQSEVPAAAPEGELIRGYCVKAAGNKQEEGEPVYVALAEPVAQVVVRHPEGGNITHYALVTVAATPEPEPTTDPTPTTDPGPFDWNWTYDAPTCDALTVTYPSNIPSGQANDVNIRIETDHGQQTLNFHNNAGTWAGTTTFAFTEHPSWPVGLTDYHVTWVQVGGTNYHWQGDVSCTIGAVAPMALTALTGVRTGPTTVARGHSARALTVRVDQAGERPALLQRHTSRGWHTQSSFTTASDGTAVVRFPRFTRRGTFTYRVAVAGTVTRTASTSRPFTIKVR